MKFHSLHRLYEELDKFGNVRLPNASVYDYFNVTLRRAYQRMSVTSANKTREISCALKSIVKGLRANHRGEASMNE